MASPKKIAQDIQAVVGLTPATMKKWKAKVSAFRKAAAELAEGYTDAGNTRMIKARNALDDTIYDAVADVPYVPGSPQHLAPPIIELNRQRVKLVDELWESSEAKGKEANYKAGQAAIKKLDAEIREQNRPYDWMRK